MLQRPPTPAALPDAIVFDLDGTLALSHPLVFEAVREAVRPFRPATPEPGDAEIAATFGPVERGTLEVFVPPGDVAAALERFFAAYSRGLAGIAPFPGIPDLLGWARGAGLRLGVATGRSRRGADLTLSSLGLADFFETVVTGDDVSRPKPDPEPVARALAALGVAPARALYVGDTPADVLSSHEAGAGCVAALWGAADPAAVLGCGPDLAFRSPAEFLGWLRARGG